MIRQLERYRRRGCRVEVIYLDRHGQLSQREVVILSIRGGRVRVYCYAKDGIREFIADNILAIMPAKGLAS